MTPILYEHYGRNEDCHRTALEEKGREKILKRKRHPCYSHVQAKQSCHLLILMENLGFVTASGCRDITALEVGKNAGMSHSVLFYQDGLRGIYTSHVTQPAFFLPISVSSPQIEGAESDLIDESSPSIINITVKMEIIT